jgi:ankyrin repeat protein
MKIAVLLFVLLLPFACAAEPRQLLQEGLFEEEANRDLDKASAAYESLIASFDKERQFAATALFRLAEIRAKQNRKEDAVALFQRVATEFSTNDPLARLSRERIAALGGTPVAPGGDPTVSDKERQEIVRLQDLVKNSPDLLNFPTEGVSPLGQAAQHGWLKAATFLLDQGADVNGRRSYSPPIHLAASDGRKAIVELLIARGADVNATDSLRRTPLQLAAENTRVEVARVLLDHGAKVDRVGPEPGNKKTALHIACFKGDRAMARLLLEKKADVNTVVEYQAQLGTPRLVSTPLTEAVQMDNVELVTLLLDHGANPNLPENDPLNAPLQRAVESSSEALVKLLLDRGAKPTSPNLIFAAIDSGDFDLVKMLAKQGADLNAKVPNAQGQTALHRMVMKSLEATRTLLELGASPKAADGNGNTPLHFAVTLKRPSESQPADIGIAQPPPIVVPQPTRSGSPNPTRKRVTSISGPRVDQPVLSVDMCQLLLKHGADINARNLRGETPLVPAVQLDAPDENLEWLLANGVDATIKNAEGYTAIEGAPLARRIWLEQRTLYPKLAKERAIHAIIRPGSGIFPPYRIDPLAEFDTSPDMMDVITRALKNNNPFQVGPLFDVLIFRKTADGKMVELARLDRNSGNPSGEPPHLQWGDIVVICDNSVFQSNAFPAPKTVAEATKDAEKATRTISVNVGNRESKVDLFGSSSQNAWSPVTGNVPEWRLSELVTRVVDSESHADLGAVKVQRKVDGEMKEWVVDLRSDSPTQRVKDLAARLADGDRVVVPLKGVDDAASINDRKSGIFRVAPGRIFGECVFRLHEKDNAPRSLGELIEGSYGGSNLIVPEPDFSNVRVYRLKPDNSGEDTITVNLAKSIDSVSTKTSRQEAIDLDFPLQWGDIVEIPTKKDADISQWRGLTPQTKFYLTKALSRQVLYRTNNGNTEPVIFAPSYREFQYTPTLNDSGFWFTSKVPTSDFRPMRFATKHSKNQVKIRLVSGPTTREFTPEEFKSINPWLIDNDLIDIESY